MRSELAPLELGVAESESTVFLYQAQSNPYLQQVRLRLQMRGTL